MNKPYTPTMADLQNAYVLPRRGKSPQDLTEFSREFDRAILREVTAHRAVPVEQNKTADCEHCIDGHRSPLSRPWAAWVGSERDSDGQPTHIRVAPTAGQHVAESDAEWLRDLIRGAVPVEPGAAGMENARILGRWLFENYPSSEPDIAVVALAVLKSLSAVPVEPECQDYSWLDPTTGVRFSKQNDLTLGYVYAPVEHVQVDPQPHDPTHVTEGGTQC